ncbi:hypothetical protein JKP88DRAFT_170998, partial [Tribonema minus]
MSAATGRDLSIRPTAAAAASAAAGPGSPSSRRGSGSAAAGGGGGGGGFRLGQKVECNFRGKGRWFPARIVGSNADGTFDVRYDDGDEEAKLSPRNIRSAAGAGPGDGGGSGGGRSAVPVAAAAAVFASGDSVEAKVRGRLPWTPAKIRFRNRDGTYDVRFTDGEQESNVEAANVRAAPAAAVAATGSGRARDDALATSGFEVGEEVEARFGGRARWFKGTVMRRNRDGTFFVRYVDGDEETSVEAALIRKVGSGGAPATALAKDSDRRRAGSDVEDRRALAVGDEVEANFKGKGRWFKGKIRAVNRDGTYDVRYADGDAEDGVEGRHIRRTQQPRAAERLESKPSDSNLEVATFQVGDEVEARFGGRSRWFKCTVMRRNRDGTFMVRYADGDEEPSVEAALIRKVAGIAAKSIRRVGGAAGASADARGKVLETFGVGDDVEANYKGKGRWFKGRVRMVNRDGTYDVRYADGDAEDGVEARHIRLVGSKPTSTSTVANGESPAAATSDRRQERILQVDDSAQFRVGDDVEANFKGKGRWFKGRVRMVNRDGTYDVRYADGDSEDRVPARNMRRLATASTRDAPAGRSATSTRDTPAGRGDSKPSADSDAEPARASRLEVAFEVGQEVEARFGGRARWFRGTVLKRNRDGTFFVRYSDGDEEPSVEPSLMRAVETALSTAARGARRGSGDAEAAGGKGGGAGGFRPGDEIEANFKGRGRWFKGSVRAANRDGTYDVRYADGDTEDGVTALNIRSLAQAMHKDDSRDSVRASDIDEVVTLRIGDEVEANFKGKGRWFKGTVKAIHRDGTYDIRYVDGDSEEGVPPKNVRSLAQKRSSPSRRKEDSRASFDSEADAGRPLEVGVEVEAIFKGKGRWFKGKIRAVNRDGTYDVRYADGDTEEGVPPRNVRRMGGSSSDQRGGSDQPRAAALNAQPFEVGDRVEARFAGRSRWLRGTVVKRNRDGTCHVRYADGEEERAVEPEMMRRWGGLVEVVVEVIGPVTDDGDTRSERASSAALEKFTIGDEVEANFKGKGRWFKGTVRAVHRDGTYDVRYADGDKEEGVTGSNLRSVTTKPASPRKADSRASITESEVEDVQRACRLGDEVEANFKGKGRWFKGTVKAVHRDGTYDIRYADGDSEQNVPPKNVRSLAGSKSPTASPRKAAAAAESDAEDNRKFEVGDEVEANFKGKGRWFKGTVRAVHRDGTYDVRYADGDTEDGVTASNLRALKLKLLASRSSVVESEVEEVKPTFRVGDEVEANFKGKGHWFKGTVKAVHRDGTYDIRYADGDTEQGVTARNLRALDKTPTSPRSNGGRGGATSASDTDAPALRVGDRAEARAPGSPRWQQCSVTGVHRDGTYDVHFRGSGAEQRRLPPRSVRARSAAAAAAADASEAEAPPLLLRVGARAEACRDGRWQQCSVTAVHRDGTVDVRWSSGGGAERGLSPRALR